MLYWGGKRLLLIEKNALKHPKISWQKQPRIGPTYLINNQQGATCLKYFLNVAMFQKNKKPEEYALNNIERSYDTQCPIWARAITLNWKEIELHITQVTHIVFTDNQGKAVKAGCLAFCLHSLLKNCGSF